MKLPHFFNNTIINTFGLQGEAWLSDLPNLISKYEDKFNIVVGDPLPDLSFSYTARCKTYDGDSVVIKICVPSSEVENEIQALNLMRGDGIVCLLNSDSQDGILLLEALVPGNNLVAVKNDTEAMSIAAGIMTKIWKAKPWEHEFPTTEKWFQRLDQFIDLPAGFSPRLIAQAKQLASDLHQDIHHRVLLHGDLHHFNILSAGREPWLAIDPKGVIGESEYEVGALLRNPIPAIANKSNLKQCLERRATDLSDLLGFDQQKVVAWGFAQAVLAAVWAVDAHSKDWPVFLHCANVLNTLLS